MPFKKRYVMKCKRLVRVVMQVNTMQINKDHLQVDPMQIIDQCQKLGRVVVQVSVMQII